MATRLEEILSIVTANSEEAVDDFLVIAHPENHEKEEIQETFEEVIGYDPLSYFDKKELGEKLDSMIENHETPEDVAEDLADQKDEIVDAAYEIFDDSKSDYLDEALNEAIEEKVGYVADPDNDDDSNDDFDDEY